MIIGFALAAYAIVANDSIQTLGTFLSSNARRPWWMLWIWISGILLVTVLWGWFNRMDPATGLGDPAFGRLAHKHVAFPPSFNWLYIIPPLALVILTRSGIPVSTTFLVLTAFSSITAYQLGGTPGAAGELLWNMTKKSFFGYGLAFAAGLGIFALVTAALERRFLNDDDDGYHPVWTVFQWVSTGFLWCMWLIQDLANVFVYLPRELGLGTLVMALAGMVILQGILFRIRGGRIQAVVTSKTNTLDIRSATFIDLFYGLVLLFFKVDYIPKLFKALEMDVPWPSKLPMSTTWVFLGLLAGREVGLMLRLRHRRQGLVSRLVFSDAGKAFIGMVVSIVIAFVLPPVARIMFEGGEKPATEEAAPEAEAE